MINLFKSSLVFYRRHFKIIFYLLALPVVLRVIIELLRIENLAIPLAIGTVILVLVNTLAQIAFIYLVIDEGKSTVREYLERSRKIFWPFLLVTLLAGFASMGATALLIIPGIILAVWLALSSFIMVAEGRRGLDALVASWQYVSGHWWKVFGYLAFLILILVLALVVVYLVFEPFASLEMVREIISAIVSGLILSPVGVVYLFSLYRGLKTLKGEAQVESPDGLNKKKWLITFVALGVAVVIFAVMVTRATPKMFSPSAMAWPSFAGLGFLSNTSL